MGLICTYLSEPVTEKESSDGSNGTLVYGASCMQGWRPTQEDAHNCIPDYDTDTSFFAVYDGHGGHEVAQYCSQELPNFIKDTPEYKEGNIEEALINGFLRFDALIATPKVTKILKDIADSGKNEDSEEDDEENVKNLYEEAAMPIEQVIEKYAANIENAVLDKLKKSEAAAKEKESDDTVGTSSASCSSSSNSNEANSSTETDKNGEKEAPENQNTVGSSSDVKEQVVATSSDNTDLVQNGEIPTPSSEAQNENEVPTSSTPVENGTPSKKGKGKAVIKPEPAKTQNIRPKRNAQQLYKKWLDIIEDSDDSDEDQTFEGPNEESSEEEGEGVNVSIDASDESSEEAEEEEDEDESKDDLEDEEDDEDIYTYWAKKREEGPGVNSGCTAVVALLRGRELYVANAGDSRCIVCRNGKAVEMSIDHKPEDEPERDRIVKAGGEVTCDGRVNSGLNLSRAIGDHTYKRNKELSDREQMITALPDIKKLTIDPNEDEFIVLACDGIWNSMSSQEVVDFVRPRIKDKTEKLSQICEEVFDHCLSPYGDDSPGCDNMTAIIVKFKSRTTKRAASPLSSEETSAKQAKTDVEDSEAQADTTV